MLKHSCLLLLALISSLTLFGCSTEPKSTEAKDQLIKESDVELSRLKADDRTFDHFLKTAYAYAIFPSVGKGGVGIGGAYGHGLVYQNGAMIGYTDLRQATIGLQLGGQTYTEVICFQTKEALDKFKSSNFAFSANASAVAIKSGSAATADYENGVAVFTDPHGGLMLEASVGGQEFTYRAKGT